ncbi:MAG: TRAP transporter small permease subunit [Eubacteriales bacterium]|nr:TRAP transporter small permease subunit [Eubacteriales bacterium]
MLKKFTEGVGNSFLARAVTWVYQSCIVISGLVIFLAMVAEVVLRYILKMNLFGIDEVILCFAIWFYFCGGINGSKEDSQIRADIISVFFKSKKAAWTMRIVSRTIEIIVTVFLTILAYDLILNNIARMPTTQGLKIPLIVPQFAILFGWTLMAVYNIGHLLTSLASPEWKNDGGEEG